MFKSTKQHARLGRASLTLSLCLTIGTGWPLGLSAQTQTTTTPVFTGIGRTATVAEIRAWDIDVRPDLKGLPAGSGKVLDGQIIWENKCASCHGTFGESNEFFTPLVGGTTAEDIKRGRVASLLDSKQPQRSTVMKVATVSSLYDYIYRAMPWNAPRSLTANDTFAVLAYMLNLAEILPDDFELSDKNMAEVQKLMPNRHGMTRVHGLWKTSDAPDVNSIACMTDCVETVEVISSLPDYARNAHHNLSEQNRAYGPFRGVNTDQPPLRALPGSSLGALTAAAQQTNVVQTENPTARVSPADLFKKQNCYACHATHSKLVGPALTDIAAKYKGQTALTAKLAEKVIAGGSGNWGAIPMPAQIQLSQAEALALVTCVLTTH